MQCIISFKSSSLCFLGAIQRRAFAIENHGMAWLDDNHALLPHFISSPIIFALPSTTPLLGLSSSLVIHSFFPPHNRHKYTYPVNDFQHSTYFWLFLFIFNAF
jgi:hypothetical protein